MRINLRELRNALRCTKKTGPQPGVVLRCRKVPEDDRATLTLEDTVSPGEDRPDDGPAGDYPSRAGMNREPSPRPGPMSMRPRTRGDHPSRRRPGLCHPRPHRIHRRIPARSGTRPKPA